jgi:hypothetical protein
MAQGFNSLGNSMSAGFSGMTEQLTKLPNLFAAGKIYIKHNLKYVLKPTFNKRKQVYDNGRWIGTNPIYLN